MTCHPLLKRSRHLLPLLLFAACAQAAPTDISTVPLETYSAPTSTDVKPNVLFVLDDSGSMDWDFMPDWACVDSMSFDNSSCSNIGQTTLSTGAEYQFRNAAYNGIYYNAAIRYKPPIAVDSAGAANTTTFPGMTGAATATGADSTTKPNWKAVKNDAYGIQSTSTTDLDPRTTTRATYFYTIIPGEYCTTPSLRVCNEQTAATSTYPYPAPLRWCSSAALTTTTCKATFDATYAYARMPTPNLATITVAGTSSTTVSQVTVNGVNILSAATASATNATTMAGYIAANINKSSAGYVAYASGAIVTIAAPYPATITYAPAVVKTGTMTFTVAGFARQGSTQDKAVKGASLLTIITPDRTTYTYPNTATKWIDPTGSSRDDCAGTTCTYNEEMTNFANWWTYYRTRMQMMKTAASNAFSSFDSEADVAANVSRFRVGYLSINNNTSSDFLNLNEFKTTQKGDWYYKLTHANPSSSTPLRAALAKAGRLYAGKLNGTTLNGSTVTDPLQYSCQQNYTILSTDGFWNESSGYYKINGSTDVGNQDAGLPRPLYDGGSAYLQAQTSTLQQRTISIPVRSRTSTLQTQTISTQFRTSQLQSVVANLVRRTSGDYGATWTAWLPASSCTWDTGSRTRTDCGYSDGATTDVSACTRTTRTGTSGTWSGNAIRCQYAEASAWQDMVGACTTIPQSTGPTNYTVGLARECNTTYGTLTNATEACTASATTGCVYTNWSSWSAYGDATCSAMAQSTGPNYTVLTATECQSASPTYGPWQDAASCTVSSTLGCQYTSWTSWSNVASCTPASQSTASPYTVGTATQCQTIATSGTSNTLADVAAYYYGTDLRDATATSPNNTGTCTGPIIPPNTTANDLCANNVPQHGRDVAQTQHMTLFTLGLGAQGQMTYSLPSLWDSAAGKLVRLPNSTYWDSTAGDFYDVKVGTSTNTTSGICSWQTTGACNWSTPASNSIANIDDLWHAAINGRGQYFSASDPASLADGLEGTLKIISVIPIPGAAAAATTSNPNISSSDNYLFSSSYKSVDWYGELILQIIDPTSGNIGSQQWSAMQLLDCATTPWKAATSYAVGAVYGRGTNCYSVSAAYTSGATFNGTVAAIDTANTTVIPNASPVTRTIYTKGTSALIPFQWASLSGTQQAYFTAASLTYAAGPPATGLSQFCSAGASCLTSTAQTNTTIATFGARGEALVNYLRGDRTNEGVFYRQRPHVLGDLVSSESRYVQTPLFNYIDAGYADFKVLKTSRTGAVYIGSNDGMLHAFDAATGQENWAYIPSFVLPNLYALADFNYSTQHQFFVDGTPEVGDICPNAPSSTCTAGQWKTILVGGLNRGGKGYYALDVTNPASPSLLWEFTDTNLGYAFGNPVITKLKDRTWVVLLASGYNNADGKGRIYVLNANTGALIRSIATSAGDAATPSGMATIVGHAMLPLKDNTSVAAYGGDTFGNLWRFDINGDIGASGYDAQLLATLTDASGTAQPITAEPTVITYGGSTIVYVGTGRFLGTSDVANTSTQSFYAMKDRMGTTAYGSIRADSRFVQQTLTTSTCPTGALAGFCDAGQTVRISSNNAVDWSVKDGWYMDFPTAGERSVTNPVLQLGTLLFTTITPAAASANACGLSDNNASFLYALDYTTGGSVSASGGVAGVSLGSGLATAPTLFELPNGTVKAIVRVSDNLDHGGTDMGNSKQITPPVNNSTTSSLRRVSWRELSTQ